MRHLLAGRNRRTALGLRSRSRVPPLVLHLVEDVLAVTSLAAERQGVPRIHIKFGDEDVSLVAVRVAFVCRLHEFDAGLERGGGEDESAILRCGTECEGLSYGNCQAVFFG